MPGDAYVWVPLHLAWAVIPEARLSLTPTWLHSLPCPSVGIIQQTCRTSLPFLSALQYPMPGFHGCPSHPSLSLTPGEFYSAFVNSLGLSDPMLGYPLCERPLLSIQTLTPWARQPATTHTVTHNPRPLWLLLHTCICFNASFVHLMALELSCSGSKQRKPKEISLGEFNY